MRIVAPHFVAGVLVEGGRIVGAAPILRWAVHKRLSELAAYCRRKGWEMAQCSST